MLFNSLDTLFKQVENNPNPPVLAVVGAESINSLQAAKMAKDRGVAIPVLYGDRDIILTELEQIGEKPSDYQIVPCSEPLEAAQKAIADVREDRAKLILKGDIHTSILMREVLNKTTGIRDSKCLTNLAIVEIPKYHKLLAFSDGAILIEPSLEQKVDMIQSISKAMLTMGYGEVKIAILAASDEVSEKQKETLDAVALKKMYLDGLFPEHVIVDGPMAFDLAVDKSSVIAKHFESPVAGDADLILVHNIVVANAVTKALRIFADGESAGIVLGAKAPIVVTSRGASVISKYLSIQFAAAAASK